jgi:hypothetical protein
MQTQLITDVDSDQLVYCTHFEIAVSQLIHHPEYNWTYPSPPPTSQPPSLDLRPTKLVHRTTWTRRQLRAILHAVYMHMARQPTVYAASHTPHAPRLILQVLLPVRLYYGLTQLD